MQAQFNQAVTFHKAGNLKAAEDIYRQLLSIQPDHPVVNARLATLLQQSKRLVDSLPFFACAIEGLPSEVELIMQAVALANQLGETKQAESWLRAVLIQQPKHALACEQLAGVLVANHNETEALDWAKQSIKLNPQNANAYNLKGLALSRLGETEKGYKCFQKAIKLNPGQLGVIRNLILYGKGKKEPTLEALIPQLESQLARGLPDQAKMNIAYILAMYYEKADAAKGFSYLKLGNDCNRKGYHYDHLETVAMFSSLTKGLGQDLKLAFEGAGLSDASPIFILGMPRSGTTLIEQILSSHSRVEAEGEMEDLRQSFELSSDHILNLGLDVSQRVTACIDVVNRYLSGVKARQKAQFFTDKMPYNFMMLGLIAMALPNAKIIHCTRDPLETCYSIYKQNFSGSHAYTNDLVELGQYYTLYQSQMTHWNELFGAQIYEANYEKMVENSEQEIANVLAYCGLEVEPQCLEFHKNKRAVRTASVAQVRQPIYKDAMKASTPVAKYLQPLRDVLGY